MLPLTMLAMVATSPGQTFGVSIFNEPMRQSLQLSHGQLALAYTLGTVLGAIPMMAIGACLDRRGPRATILVVLSCFCTACLLTSLVANWWMLTAAFFLLRMLGPGALSLLSSGTLPYWFDRRLGLVEGLRSVGHAGSMATVPALNLYLVSEFGWRGAYGLLGIGIWLVLFPLYYLWFRDDPADVGQRVDGQRVDGEQPHRGSETRVDPASSATEPSPPWSPRGDLTLGQCLRTYSFWVAAVGTASFGLVMTAIFFCLVPIFQERGLSEQHAATTMMVFAISLAVTQLLGGAVADRFRAPPLMACGLFGLAAGVALLHQATVAWLAVAAGLLMGAGLGIHAGAVQPLWARYFGRCHLGKIRGVLTTMNIAMSSIGPLVAGLVRDWQGNFNAAMWVFILLPLPLAVMSWFAAPPKRAAVSDPVSSSPA